MNEPATPAVSTTTSNPNQHQHKFLATAVQPAKTIGDNGVMAQTIVISHCECGEFQWSQVPGTWTLADMKGTSSTDDATFLKQMGIDVPAVLVTAGQGPGGT